MQGKSSMVAALSKSSIYVDDRLFATLDPRVRSVVLPSGRKVLLSDTVGFISDLPVQLVEAFQATLEEVVEADFLLHVIDGSAANVDEQREAVLDVLKGIGVPKAKLESCMVEAWNKVDLIEGVSTFEDHSILLAKDTDPSPTKQEESSNSNLFSKDDEVMSNGVTTGLGKRDESVILGLGWSQGGISRVGTSASKGIGLGALLHLLDKKLGEELAPQFAAHKSGDV
jgi:50S ribosomal subunit-associated GTPase HflX